MSANTITPGSAATVTADVTDTDKSLPILRAGTRVIISYITIDRATVIVQPIVTARPIKGGDTRAGLTTTGGTMRTVPLSQLTPIMDGWQFFEPAGYIGSE
jgi:hypothetical protein